MTTEQKVACCKLGLLELAYDLGYVSKACNAIGYSRLQFYGNRPNFQTFGAADPLDQLPVAKTLTPRMICSKTPSSTQRGNQ